MCTTDVFRLCDFGKMKAKFSVVSCGAHEGINYLCAPAVNMYTLNRADLVIILGICIKFRICQLEIYQVVIIIMQKLYITIENIKLSYKTLIYNLHIYTSEDGRLHLGKGLVSFYRPI